MTNTYKFTYVEPPAHLSRRARTEWLSAYRSETEDMARQFEDAVGRVSCKAHSRPFVTQLKRRRRGVELSAPGR